MRDEIAQHDADTPPSGFAAVWWALPRLWRLVILVGGSWLVLVLVVLGITYATGLFT